MKVLLKASLLLASIPLVLSSCTNLDNRIVYLETSNTVNYVEGKCFQATYKNVVETIYLMALPNNPEADPTEYTYDITWNMELKNSYFDFQDGLKGKSLISVLRLGDGLLKLNIAGMCESPNSKYGYIKVFRYAFTANTKKLQDTSIFAYVAIGEQSSLMVDKPALDEDGNPIK